MGHFSKGQFPATSAASRWEIAITTAIARLIRDYPFGAYVILAYVFSISLALLLNVSLAFGLIALFGPATAAFLVARVWHGRAGVTELWAIATRWRVHPAWYAAALGLPLAAAALGHVGFIVAGNPPLAIPGSVQPILLLLFFLVIGEEIGWRGFLLRGLLRNRSPLVATAVVAVVWAMWHTPLYFIPGMPSYGNSFVAFVVWVVPFSFLLTWLWLGTRSAWLATVMHGSGNLAASIVFPVADPGTLFTFYGIAMAIIAVLLVAPAWSAWTTVQPPETSPPALAVI
ncbi:MAG TPA: CPBP family intramembrane glutamic endopeptidase [Candidatus Limnocylindrales bacterium]|nr:CPBP family intramembrane glutamic endopeptidase [Candidatus Limnocylindrales bacterium]